MKKLFTLALIVVMSLATGFKAMAIEDPFPKGTKIVGIQAGAFSINSTLGANAYLDYVLFDNWWKGHFTVGAQVAYGIWLAHSYTSHTFVFDPRATYGINITDKFEVHAGAVSGIRYRLDTDGYKSAGFSWGSLVGVRYFFSDSFGVTAEMNYADYLPLFNVGVNFKL